MENQGVNGVNGVNEVNGVNGENEGNEVNGVDNTQTSVETPQINPDNHDLILGKFKSIEDLASAYKNIQSQQGQQSKEIGELRKKAEMLDNIQKQQVEFSEAYTKAKEYLNNYFPKYNKDEYFKNSDFNSLYQEAFNAMGTGLDTDRFVSMLDKYVSSRINLYEKAKSAKNENETAKSNMQFSKSSKESKPALPKLDSIPENEIDKIVAKYI